MWKKSEIRYKLKKYNWRIYCVIIAIAVFLILYYCYPDTDQANARYILSAISQGLAAILALVFTITLVVSQMTRRYTAMDKIIFRHETILLMIVFAIGVVTPLLVLKRGFWGQSVNLSIAVAVFCVFSLLPFLKGVNGVLKYDIGIVNLDEEIMEAIELGYKPRALNKIRELNEIGEIAIKESREDVILRISHNLSRIGLKSAEKKFWYVTLQVVYALENIGLKSVEKGFKYNSTRGIVDGLRYIASKTLKEIEVYLFSWNSVPGDDDEKFKESLRDDFDIGWVENAEILKSDDGKIIRIFKDENSAEIIIDKKKEKASLKISDGRTLDLKVKKENGKLNIYIEVSGDFKDAVIVEVLKGLSDIGVKAAEKGLEDIIKDVAEHLTYVGKESGNKEALFWLWCLGAAATKYMSRFVVDIIVIRNIKELEETISGDWVPLAERYCTDHYLDLKDAFEEFKRRYKEG